MSSDPGSNGAEVASMAKTLPTVEEVFRALETDTQTLRDRVAGARRLLTLNPRFLDEPKARAHAAACLSRLESSLTEGAVFLHMANRAVQAQAELEAEQKRRRIATLREDAKKAQGKGDATQAALLLDEAERLEAGVSQLPLNLGGHHG